MELILIIGIAMMILLGSTLMMYQYANYSTDSLISAKVNDIGRSMIRNAGIMNIYGAPARIIVEYNFPENLKNISVVENHTLIFDVDLVGNNAYPAFYTDVNLTLGFTENDFYAGKRRILIEAKGNDIVLITTVKNWTY